MAEVKRDEIYQKDLFKPLIEEGKETIVVLEGLDKGFQELSKTLVKFDKDLENIDSKTIESVNKAFEESNKIKEQASKVDEQLRKENEKTNKTREKTKKSLTEEGKIREKITKAESKQGKSLAKFRQELLLVNKANREAAKETLITRDAYEELTDETNEAQKRLKRLAAEFGATSKEVKEARDEFERLDKRLSEVNEAAKDGRRDVGRYKNEIKELSDELKGAANNAGGFGDTVSAITSPIGLASAAAAGIGAAFTATSAGGAKVNDVLSQLKGGFNAVTSSVGGFVNSLIEGESVTEAYGNNLDGLTDKIENQAQANLEATQAQRQNRIDLRTSSEELARLRGEFELLQQQAGNATKTLEEQNEKLIASSIKAAEITAQEIVEIQKNIEAVDLQIKAREGLNNADFLDERQEFINQQIELEGQLAAELAAIQQERDTIEQDQFEQRLDFLFDASDRQKSITEEQINNDRLATEERVRLFQELSKSIIKTFNEIEKEFQEASGQQINIAEFANLEATAQAELLTTLNLSEIGRNRLKEAVVEYLQVVQDLDAAQQDLNDVESESISIQNEIEAQRKKLADQSFDLDREIRENRKNEIDEELKLVEAGSIRALELEREKNNILLKEQDQAQKAFEKSEKDRLKTVEENAKKEEEIQAKKQEQLLETANLVLEAAGEGVANRLEQQLSSIDSQLDSVQSRADDLRAAAAAGNANSSESLAELQKQESDLQVERKKRIEDEQNAQKVLTYFKLVASNAEQGDPNPAAAALKDMLLSEVIVKGIESFFVGTERLDGVQNGNDPNGGRLINAHTDERIMTGEQNNEMKKAFGYDVSNEALKNMVIDSKNGLIDNVALAPIPMVSSNRGVERRIESMERTLNKTLKSLPGLFPVYTPSYDVESKIILDKWDFGNKIKERYSKNKNA